jgi:hypothetical protein
MKLDAAFSSGTLVRIYHTTRHYVEFEVFTAVVMTPCNPSSVNRRFGGTYRLNLQGRRNKCTYFGI